jgi:hypothetical protein
MGKKSSPKPPDLTPLANILQQQGDQAWQIGQEQLAWSREQDAKNRELLDQVLGIQMPAMENQARWAQEDRQRYEGVFQPIEDDLIRDFQEYGSPERMGVERGRAMADVASNFDAQRRNALQRLESYGVDPSMTRNAALDVGVRTAQAAAMAAAGTNATRNVEDKSRALRADALNIGRGMPSQVAQSYGQAVAAGQSGLGGANSTFGTSSGAMGSPGQWAGMGMQGMNQSGNMLSQGFSNQMQAHNANMQASQGLMSGIGGLAGMAMGLADGRRPVDQAIPTTPGHIAGGPGDGSGIDDQVPATIVNPKTGAKVMDARVSTEEYIIPADVVAAKGVEFFDKLLARYHTPAAEQRESPSWRHQMGGVA